jgi:hypothetical protein
MVMCMSMFLGMREMLETGVNVCHLADIALQFF